MSHASDVADWCQRELDLARKTGEMDPRCFVQNMELIIAALRAYEGANHADEGETGC
jgi:hypothetical protein